MNTYDIKPEEIFDIEDREYSLISQILLNPKIFVKYMPHLKKSYFEAKKNMIIIDVIHNYCDEYEDIPTYSKIELSSGFKINKVKDKWDTQYLEQQVSRFIANMKMKCAIEDSIELLDDENYTEIEKVVSEATDLPFNNDVKGMSVYDIENIFDDLTAENKKLPTGWKNLDTLLNGGVVIPSLNYFVAKSGYGKSISLINLAHNFIKQGKDVIYITLELDEKTVMRRYFQHSVKITENDFANSKNKIIAHLTSNPEYGKFSTQYYGSGTLSSFDVENIINKYIQIEEITPIVMLDYAGLMKPNSSSHNITPFEKDKSISEELRNVAVKYDTVVWTVEQFNRSGAGENDDVSEENIQGGLSKVQTCDNMFAMIPNNVSKELGIINCKIFKARSSNCAGQYFKLQIDWTTLTFSEYKDAISSLKTDKVSKPSPFKKAGSKREKRVKINLLGND